jgi:hypothetical protein
VAQGDTSPPARKHDLYLQFAPLLELRK